MWLLDSQLPAHLIGVAKQPNQNSVTASFQVIKRYFLNLTLGVVMSAEVLVLLLSYTILVTNCAHYFHQ